MTILILNWRDIKNPAGGGAELLTHELAKRWVKSGHNVIQFSATFPKGKKEEIIDGVKIIRRGQWWSVQFFAFFYYQFILQKKIDIIIDEVHWFPFFSVLYAPQKTVAFVCEVANKLFYTIFPYPIAAGWRVLEKMYLSLYKNVPTMAISQSTKEDLLVEGHNSSNIIVIPMGLTTPAKIKHFPKEKLPTVIYVARLNRQKGIFEALDAFVLVKNQLPEAKLWIVGSGQSEVLSELKRKIKEDNLNKSVTLFGFVSQEKKFELLSRAHLLISASVQEGWGLTVPEAGLTRTPSVVYNIQGFRDIIENKKDGLLVERNPDALAQGILKVLNNKELYKKMQSASERKAKSYSWETSSKAALQFLQKHD